MYGVDDIMDHGGFFQDIRSCESNFAKSKKIDLFSEIRCLLDTVVAVRVLRCGCFRR